MLVAVGWGNSFGSWLMSKVTSSDVTSGGVVLTLLRVELAAATGLLSSGVASAMIGVVNTAFYC